MFRSVFSTDWLDDFENDFINKKDLFNYRSFSPVKSFTSVVNDDGNLELSINAVGHDPDDIEINSTKSRVTVKSEYDGDNPLISSIDFSFKISEKFDSSTANASFKNGILTILFNPFDDERPTKVKIKT